MRTYKFFQVDVFAESRFGGKPLAVFPQAQGLTAEEMEAIAFELNLPKTAFVFPAESDDAQFKLRVFNPVSELSVAGQPAIGAHYVLARQGVTRLSGDVTRVAHEISSKIFPVDIFSEGGRIGKISIAHEPPKFLDEIDDLESLAKGLCCEVDDLDLDFGRPQVVSCGVASMMVPVKSLQVLGDLGLDVSPLRQVCEDYGCTMAYAFTIRETLREGSIAQARFFSGHLLFEDSATASAAGSLGAFLASHGFGEEEGDSRFVIDQGDFSGRPSRIYVTVNASGNAEVAGYCRHVFEAELQLEE